MDPGTQPSLSRGNRPLTAKVAEMQPSNTGRGIKRSNVTISTAIMTSTDRSALADVSSPQTAEAEGQLLEGYHETLDLLGLGNMKLERRPTSNLSKGDRREEERVRRLQEDEKRAEYADKIAKEIKLYYLRTTFAEDVQHNLRDQRSAVRFLHGTNTQSKFPS
jgi:hypothetical protein